DQVAGQGDQVGVAGEDGETERGGQRHVRHHEDAELGTGLDVDVGGAVVVPFAVDGDDPEAAADGEVGRGAGVKVVVEAAADRQGGAAGRGEAEDALDVEHARVVDDRRAERPGEHRVDADAEPGAGTAAAAHVGAA